MTLVGSPLAFGLIAGALASPLVAQQIGLFSACCVGENSGVGCSGDSICSAGNTSGLNTCVWVVRLDGETSQFAYQDGKKLATLSEPN